LNSSDNIHQGIKRIITAIQNGDYQTVIEMTYPPLVNAMGGKAKAVLQITNFMNSPIMKTFKIHSFDLKEPYQFFPGEKRKFVIIEFTSIMEMLNKKVEATGFQFGICEDNLNWYFIDGEKMNDLILTAYFPELINKISLPKVTKKYLDE